MGDEFNIMAYIVDIVILAFFFIFAAMSAKKGFVNCIFGFVSSIVAIVVAFSFAAFVANVTGGLFGLQDTMETSMVGAFSQLSGFDVPLDPNANITDMLASQDLSTVMVNLIAQNWANVEIPAGHTLAMIAGEAVSQFATVVISGVALYLVLRVVLVILKKFFNFVFKDGALGSLNKILGAAVGLIEAVLFASIAVAILSMFPAMMPFLNSSIILTALYNNNPLMWLISLFLLS